MHNISDIVIKINCNFFLSAWLENILHQDLVLKPIYIFVRGEHKKKINFFFYRSRFLKLKEMWKSRFK